MRSTVTWPLLRSFTREQQNCKSNKISKLQNHISDLQGCIHAACGEKVVHEVVQHLLMYHRVVNVGEQGRRARMAGSRSIFFCAHGDARGIAFEVRLAAPRGGDEAWWRRGLSGACPTDGDAITFHQNVVVGNS